jgi:hypothetical protein
MKDGSINLTTQRFAMKEEKSTTVMSLVSPKDKWEKIGLQLEDEWQGVDIEQVLQECPSPQGDSLCAIEAYTLANQGMEVLNDEEKSESTKSNLDDMWYTGDKESNIQDLEEEMNTYIIDGLHVPHDEMEGCKKVTKRHLHSLRLVRLQQRQMNQISLLLKKL